MSGTVITPMFDQINVNEMKERREPLFVTLLNKNMSAHFNPGSMNPFDDAQVVDAY